VAECTSAPYRPCYVIFGARFKSMSHLVTAAVGLACKAVLSSGFCSLAVRGLPVLTNALESAARDEGQGVLTGVCVLLRINIKN